MSQAPLFDGLSLDPLSLQQDGLAASEVDVGRGEIVEAFVVAPVIVVLDEGGDLPVEIARQEVVFEQNAVLQRLMPALDLALGLGWLGAPRVCSMFLIREPVGLAAGHVARAVAPTE